MVTLVGFFFILANVGLLALFVPDLIGPVRPPASKASSLAHGQLGREMTSRS